MGAIFDDAGKVRDRDALRSIQVNAAGPRRPAVAVDRSADIKTVETVNELTGGTAGCQVHHGSGRVDAVATPDVVASAASTNP